MKRQKRLDTKNMHAKAETWMEKRKRRSERIIKKNPWLKEMWKEGMKAGTIYWNAIERIEKKYQKKYNNSKDDVFFAVIEGDIIGIDWKNCRSNREGYLIQYSELENTSLRIKHGSAGNSGKER